MPVPDGPQFSPKERGEALGSIIWNNMESAMGGRGAMRKAFVTEAWDKASFPGGWESFEFTNDPDDEDAFPEVKIPLSSGYFARYQPGSGVYADIHHEDDPESAIDTVHIDESIRQDPTAVKTRVSEYFSQDDLDEQRRWM